MSFLPYGVGASLGVWSAVHRALGGFNERYARGGDDVEFCWRAQLASYTIAFAPQAVMGYRLRSRLWPLVRQGYGYGRADARLYRDFRQHGIVPRDVRAAAESWVRLARKLPQLASHEHAGDWLYTAGWRFGRLVGSIQFRVMCP
jgi:GT2 family glycosyltransferase